MPHLCPLEHREAVLVDEVAPRRRAQGGELLGAELGGADPRVDIQARRELHAEGDEELDRQCRDLPYKEVGMRRSTDSVDSYARSYAR